MNVAQLSIKETLNERGGKINVYKIPPYQREYAWGKKEWEELFFDILENNKNYFLGSIICIDNKEFFEVIDGQQRLTTLSIFLSAIYEVLLDNKLYWYGQNDEFDEFFLSLKKHLVYSKQPKLTLSIQNNNNEDYKYILSKLKLVNEIEKPSYWGKRRIAKAYKFFVQSINDIYEDENKEISVIFDLLDKVLNAIIVKIDVEDISAAFILFESINNRGKPLSPIDLIKNAIISKINENPEEINAKWQIVLKNIPEPKDQIRFLRHFYNSFGLNKPPFDILNYKKATKSNIIDIYKDYINKNVKMILEALVDKSKIYNKFVMPKNDRLIRLKKLGVAPAYVLLLFLFSESDDIDQMNKVLDLIEKWFIKRNLTDFPGTSKLDKIFTELTAKVYNQTNFYEIIKNELTKPEIFISDEDFRKFLLQKDLYNENRDLLKYLFAKLELSKRTQENNIEFLDFWEKKWSIEHILPQTPKFDEWDFTKEEYNEYVSKLGNLTLTHYNSNLSNRSFEKKSSVIDNKTKNDIGLKSGNVKINEFIKNCDKWSKECINKRSELLADEIVQMIKI